MAGISQQAFLETVRQALRNRGPAVPLPDDLEIARVVKPGADLATAFIENVEKALMHAHRAANEQALLDKIAELIDAAGAKSVIVPAEDVPARQRIIDRLKSMNVKLCDPDDPDAAFEAEVSITGVRLAIAETPSLSLVSGGARRRLASLAVPTHIAVVRAEQIIPDLLDWGARAYPDRPACETLVSSPSKTADIELNLVHGVHGPKEEHVIVLG